MLLACGLGPSGSPKIPHMKGPFPAGNRLVFLPRPRNPCINPRSECPPHPCTSRPDLPPPPVFLGGWRGPDQNTHSIALRARQSQQRKNMRRTTLSACGLGQIHPGAHQAQRPPALLFLLEDCRKRKDHNSLNERKNAVNGAALKGLLGRVLSMVGSLRPFCSFQM